MSTTHSSVAAAAALLGVSRQRVYQLIERGDLRAEVIDGRKAIRNRDLARYQQQTVEPFDHMTTREVAQRLDRSESLIRDWIATGKLPSIVRGGRRFVPCDAVASFTIRPPGPVPNDDGAVS